MEEATADRPLDPDGIRSRLEEFSALLQNDSSNPSSSEPLKDCLLHLESKFKQIESEFSDFALADLDAYVERVEEDLNSAKAESAKISEEIKLLNETYLQDSIKLEGNLELLDTMLNFHNVQGPDKFEDGGNNGYCTSGEYQGKLISAPEEYNFEMLEIDSLLQESNIFLESLLDLQQTFQRVEAVRQIEDILSGVKVIKIEGSFIRLSLKTIFPILDGLLCKQQMECVTVPFALDHELMIEVMPGTMQLKNVEIFPNDVYIGGVVEAGNSLRHSFPCQERSSLEWLVRKVQHRIYLCALRRLIVKDANNLRHSFEYSDKDETIVAHLTGNMDAFIKVSQNWPASTSALKLISLKNLDCHSRGISLSFFCKVEELANSLDAQIRSQLWSFADSIEEIVVQQQRLELQQDRSLLY